MHMPVPARFQTPDGADLQLHDWPSASPRARLLLVHGLGEHGGRYARLAGELNEAGISVRGFDHRGHGRSSGRRGGAGDAADQLSRDTCQVFASYAAEGVDRPFLLGHSLGGLLVLHAVCCLQLRPRGLVVSSPALASHASSFQRLLAGIAGRLAPALTLANGLPADRLSHAPEVERTYLDDPLNHDRISARLAHFIFSAGPAVIAAAPSLRVPTLLQVAGADRLVDAEGARDFAAAAPAHVLAWHRYEGLFHEIYNEAEPARTQVVGDLLDWLQIQIAGGELAASS